MALFNFFGISEHRVFNRKPIYYDAEKERRRKRAAEIKEEEKKETYTPGNNIRGSLRGGAYKKTRTPMKTVQTIIGIISLLLIVAILFFFLKLYPYLFVK
jgi:hypothetical protein